MDERRSRCARSSSTSSDFPFDTILRIWRSMSVGGSFRIQKSKIRKKIVKKSDHVFRTSRTIFRTECSLFRF